MNVSANIDELYFYDDDQFDFEVEYDDYYEKDYISSLNVYNNNEDQYDTKLSGRISFYYGCKKCDKNDQHQCEYGGNFDFINDDQLSTINNLISYIESNNKDIFYLDYNRNTEFYLNNENYNIITVTTGFRNIDNDELSFVTNIHLSKSKFLKQLKKIKKKLIGFIYYVKKNKQLNHHDTVYY